MKQWKIKKEKKDVILNAIKKMKKPQKNPFSQAKENFEMSVNRSKEEFLKSEFSQIFSCLVENSRKKDIHLLSAISFVNLVRLGLLNPNKIVSCDSIFNTLNQGIIEGKKSNISFFNGEEKGGNINNCLIQFRELIALAEILNFSTPKNIFIKNETYTLNMLREIETALTLKETDGFMIIPIIRDDFLIFKKDENQEEFEKKLFIFDLFPKFTNMLEFIKIVKEYFNIEVSMDLINKLKTLRAGEETTLELKDMGFDIIIVKENQKTLFHEAIALCHGQHAFTQYEDNERIITLYNPSTFKGGDRFIFENIEDYLDMAQSLFFASFYQIDPLYEGALRECLQKMLEKENPAIELSINIFFIKKIMEEKNSLFINEMRKLYGINVDEALDNWEKKKIQVIHNILNFKLDIIEKILQENKLPDFNLKNMLF